MMNNEAAPSYFNGGSLTQYKDYRWALSACFQSLIMKVLWYCGLHCFTIKYKHIVNKGYILSQPESASGKQHLGLVGN